MSFGKRILLLVPHPDDEVVASAAALGRAQQTGAQIFTLYLTTGCIAKASMWFWDRGRYEKIIAKRRHEGEKVAKLLGITPLGWSLRPARELWSDLKEVYAEIADAVQEHTIDQLWVPAYEGGNPDHDALHALASLFAKRLSVLEFAEYNFFGNKARSHKFPVSDGSETVLTLTQDERIKKLQALKLYSSEKGNLNYVKCEEECYRSFRAADYSQPPHAGTLWYARFQWVPFRHPRVDFTKPHLVSTAISAFLRARGALKANAPLGFATPLSPAHRAKDHGSDA